MIRISQISVIASTVAALGVAAAAQTASIPIREKGDLRLTGPTSVRTTALQPAALAFYRQQPSIAAKGTTLSVRRALERLPYYGVFDFLAFSVGLAFFGAAGAFLVPPTVPVVSDPPDLSSFLELSHSRTPS